MHPTALDLPMGVGGWVWDMCSRQQPSTAQKDSPPAVLSLSDSPTELSVIFN